MARAGKGGGESAGRSNPFTGVDDLIAALHPQHARTKRAPDLEPDAPARLRQLWEAIGVSRASDALSVPLLSRADSEKELARIFAEWDASPKDRGAWGGGAESFRKALPERLRLVLVRKDEVIVTDESNKDADPPLLFMRQNTRRLVRLGCRYTEFLIWRLVRALTITRNADYNRRAQAEGKQILADAYPPGLYQVADGIWTMRMPEIPDVVEDPVDPIFYVSIEVYSAFVLGLPEKQLPLFRAPRASEFWVSSSGPLDLSAGAPSGFRVSRLVGFDGRPEKWLQAVGRVDQTIVWLGMTPNGDDVQVKYNPRAEVVVEKWVKGMGLKIKRRQPLVLWSKGRRQPYDLFGW